MYAIAVSERELTWGEAPDPELRPGEVLIDVAAAGVNRADLMQARGLYPPPPGSSEILGLECAGVVTALGPPIYDDPADQHVRVGAIRAARHTFRTKPHLPVDGAAPYTPQVGDRVCALLSGGGYAEQVAVPATQVLPIPDGMSMVEAAALPEVTCTVWSNLVMTAGLRAGERVLIQGGSSGIGTMAIQVARLLGADVTVTAGTAEKLAACRELGAERVINYREQDFVDVVRAAGGADVILDVVGADYLSRNIEALADRGRLVIIGLMGGSRAELDISALMGKRASVTGTTLRSRPTTGPGSKAEVVAAVRRDLWPTVAEGRIKPVIGLTVPITRAAEAHRALRDGAVIGKAILMVAR